MKESIERLYATNTRSLDELRKSRREMVKMKNIFRNKVNLIEEKEDEYKEEIEKLKYNMLCGTCIEKEKNMACINCSVVYICDECYIDVDRCPMCKQEDGWAFKIRL